MTPRAPFLAVCVLCALTAAAQLPRNEVSIDAGWSDLGNIGGVRALGASYTRYWTPVFATQIGTMIAGDQVLATNGNYSFTETYATAEAHAFRNRLLSPWVALGIASVAFDDSERSTSDFTTIVGAGADIRITRRFALGAQWHYSPFVVDPRDRFALNVNPMTVMVVGRWGY